MRKIFLFIFLFVMPSAALAQQGARQFEKFNLQGYTDTGAKAWDVKGDTAQIEGNTVHINNVDANRYGDQQVNLTADKGQLNKESGNIHLEKNVIITAKEGGQLKTDHLDWDKNNDLVKTDAPVVITQPSQGMTATGTGLEAQPGLKTAQMMQDVTVTMKPDKTQNPGSPVQTVTITCDGPMEVDQKINKATFNINVVAIETDRTLKADIMEVFFDPDTNQIKQAICTGHVHIIQGGNMTNSDKAVFNGDDRTLTLTGRPKLIMVTGGKGAMPSLKDKEK